MPLLAADTGIDNIWVVLSLIFSRPRFVLSNSISEPGWITVLLSPNLIWAKPELLIEKSKKLNIKTLKKCTVKKIIHENI